VQELYLAALARKPLQEETDLALRHITRARAPVDGQPLDIPKLKRQSYEDLIWTLLNTKEFLFNH
jgi:hypothetical protein